MIWSDFVSFVSPSGNCSNLNELKCLNGGYLKSSGNDSTDCSCQCPPNTSGSVCQTLLSTDYYESLFPLPCGGNVSLPGYISTPGYPKRYHPNESCVWDIKVCQFRLVSQSFDFPFFI